MKHKQKSILSCLCATLIIGTLPFQTAPTADAASPRLSSTKLTIKSGKSVTLKVKYTKKKATWTIKKGKKNLRLSNKKKRSVRLTARRTGTATVQCKIGKRKLYCKVTIKQRAQSYKKGSNSPLTSTEPTPSALPVSPTVTSPALPPRSTHAPTENRLMAEPTVEYTKTHLYEENQPEYYSYGNKFYYFFGSDIRREDIECITITNSCQVPSNVLGSLDVSEKQNGSVMAWYTDIDGDNYYEMTIGQDGGVVANPDSSHLFYDIGAYQTEGATIYGLEHLYTEHVTDMSFMFMRFGVRTLDELYLPAYFDTSNVTDMSYMFAYCGANYMTSLYLDTGFNMDNVTNDKLMFFWTGRPNMACYVSNETLKNCITTSETNEWRYGNYYSYQDPRTVKLHTEYIGPFEPYEDWYYSMPGNPDFGFNNEHQALTITGKYIPESCTEWGYYTEEFYELIDDMTDDEIRSFIIGLFESGDFVLTCSESVERYQIIPDAGYFYCGYHGEMGILLHGKDGTQNLEILPFPNYCIIGGN